MNNIRRIYFIPDRQLLVSVTKKCLDSMLNPKIDLFSLAKKMHVVNTLLTNNYINNTNIKRVSQLLDTNYKYYQDILR